MISYGNTVARQYSIYLHVIPRSHDIFKVSCPFKKKGNVDHDVLLFVLTPTFFCCSVNPVIQMLCKGSLFDVPSETSKTSVMFYRIHVTVDLGQA